RADGGCGMALRRIVKLPLGVAVLGIGLGVAAGNSAAVKGFYQDIYPTDPAKRAALELCFLQDHMFNRLDSAARQACYSHALLLPVDSASETSVRLPGGVNFVDLKYDADHGSMPANDLRQHTRPEHAQPH